ncbi:MAG: hypothetical protein NZ700_02935 [Gemmataceae bacterium]|nr:hypothetical protein [Gemmataceae bacterium]MDW8266702.1 hypothetical protein [Gemmataceae bacterium]
MRIRTFEPGDEAIQAAIYNVAAANLPKFKPATTEEVRRRAKARDFDPTAHFFVERSGEAVGYAGFQPNGRVSYPWCLPGHEECAEPLFQAVLQTMQARRQRRAFAAYRGDWAPVLAFFEAHGFRKAREMVNFVVNLADTPTPAARARVAVSPLSRDDLPAVLALGAGGLRVDDVEALERHLFRNPYFGPEALFALRDRGRGEVVAVGLLIDNPTYADPQALDPFMPCFRLGAFGTEGMSVKRVHGLFSFLARPHGDLGAYGVDLLSHAVARLEESDAHALAAQVGTDLPHLLRFYQAHFRRQGSFPVYERPLEP